MAHLLLIPEWFLSYTIILELIFAVITFVIGLYSFKVYKLSNQNQTRLFGIAFLAFSISYFIQSILNYAILKKLTESISHVINLQDVNTLINLGTFVHIFFFLFGLITLAYTTLKIKSKKIYFLLLTMSLLSFFTVLDKVFWFYAFASLLLIFISLHYLVNFLGNKKFKTLIVLLAFLFLLFGHIHFIFSLNHAIYYVLGNFLELAAYFLILINLILILKHGKKKK